MLLPPHPRITSAAALLLAVAVTVSVGCGADTRRAETETTAAAAQTQPILPASTTTAPGRVVAAGPTSPARRAYVARVDRICRRLDPERNTARKRAGEAADVGKAAAVYDDTITLGERQLREIESIPPPSGDRQALRVNVFDVLRRQLVVRRRIRAALAQADVPRLRALRGELDNLTRSLVGFARGYGFQTCGED